MKTTFLQKKSTQRVLIALFLIALVVYAEVLQGMGGSRMLTYLLYFGYFIIFLRMYRQQDRIHPDKRKSFFVSFFIFFFLILYVVYVAISWNEKLPEMPFWMR
jgi:hypothetical protein